MRWGDVRYVRLQERGLDGKEGKLEVGSGRGNGWMVWMGWTETDVVVEYSIHTVYSTYIYVLCTSIPIGLRVRSVRSI
jgi:hypothetical protein